MTQSPKTDEEHDQNSGDCGDKHAEEPAEGNRSSGAPVESLTGLLDQLIGQTDGDQVTLGDLLDAFDSRSYGPLLLVPAFIAASPIGGIPGMSIVTGTLIILIAGQMLITTRRPWLPKES